MTAPTHDEILEHLRRQHEAGDVTAARHALEWCAGAGLPMPQWLASLLLRALRTSDKGKPDDLLGLGNRKLLTAWRRRHLDGRDSAIRRIDEALATHRADKTGVTKGQLIEAAAKQHNISVKAVEKILYSSKKPTRTPKK